MRFTRKPLINLLKALICVTVIATVANGFSDRPPASRTGAPGETTCTSCHIGTLNSGSGKVEIEGVPSAYLPNEEFTLTIRVSHPERRRWGFQITALDSQSNPAGTMSAINTTQTTTLNGTGSLSGRTYVEHRAAGTFDGQSNGASWEVRWKAPATDVGRVTFYAAGNAANGNSASSGDSIYTTAVQMASNGVPMIVEPVYKKGKILLQANGSDINSGAVLIVSGGNLSEAQTFALKLNKPGTKWQVKKSTTSTPGGLTVDGVLPAGTTVTLVVRNSNGMESAPATLTR